MPQKREVFEMLKRLLEPIGASFSVRSVLDEVSTFDEGSARLSLSETNHLKTLNSTKRRCEFLAGRYAARECLSTMPMLAKATPQNLETHRSLSGAPKVSGFPNISLSIAHTDEIAVATAAPFALGVDLEKDEERPAALLKYFYSDSERQRIEMLPKQFRRLYVNRLWTRKEAVAKAVEQGGALTFRDVDCSRNTVSVLGKNLMLCSASTPGFVASIAYVSEELNG